MWFIFLQTASHEGTFLLYIHTWCQLTSNAHLHQKTPADATMATSQQLHTIILFILLLITSAAPPPFFCLGFLSYIDLQGTVELSICGLFPDWITQDAVTQHNRMKLSVSEQKRSVKTVKSTNKEKITGPINKFGCHEEVWRCRRTTIHLDLLSRSVWLPLLLNISLTM